MKKLISTKDLSHEDWLRYRKQGIGGSDAGAICGLNPYVSPMSVFYEKTNLETEDYDNESMRQGRDLEEYVARRFMEETGLKVRRSNAMFQSEEYPFMLANVDLQLGYRGLIDLAYRNERMQSIEAQAVYENDEFSYELGLHPILHHKPTFDEPGEIRAFYAIFRLDNGGFRFEVMTKSYVDAFAARYSKALTSDFSPWKSNYEGMAKKTVIKQLLKFAPLKSDFQKAITLDETVKTQLSVDMSEVQNEELMEGDNSDTAA